MTNKPRTFSLHEDGLWYGSDELPPDHEKTFCHVIEYSAYQALLEQAERMAEALEEYQDVAVCMDDGDTFVAADAIKIWQEFKK